MAVTINTNIASSNAQRQLGKSSAALAESFTRLSSGLRINKASDDAAGLAIATSLKNDSRVYTQGVRNTNDGISLYSIAEGSLKSLVDITVRLKELAQQSSNGVLSYAQRKSLNAEAQALGKEYQRIINTTQFNGQNIINGSSGPLNIQVGYDALSLSGGNAPTGTFTAALSIADSNGPLAALPVDVNGDGKLDLVSADSNSSQLGVFIGNGDGTFLVKRTYSTGSTPRSATAADVNRDGLIDLISTDTSSNQISVLIGNGDGSFQANQTYATGFSPSSISAADVNGDGVIDLVTADRSSNQLSVFLGNGNGTFKVNQTSATGTTPNSVVTIDVNGDGNIDLVSADQASTQVSVFLGNGNGTFRSKQSYVTGTTPIFVTTADLNGDGVADLVTADFGSQRLSVLLGNGDGSFLARRSLSTGNNPYSVTGADINGDSIIDLISSDLNSNQFSVFIGNGDGTFLAQQTYTSSIQPGVLTTADINGDGAFDIISANYGSSQLNILLGNTLAQAVVAPTTGTYSLLTQQSSRDALTQFGKVLTRLTTSLGIIGANESRLDTVVSVLQQTRINYDFSASQISDVDVAEESSKLARTQILQQVGAAVLSQANQQPALALTLLRSF